MDQMQQSLAGELEQVPALHTRLLAARDITPLFGDCYVPKPRTSNALLTSIAEHLEGSLKATALIQYEAVAPLLIPKSQLPRMPNTIGVYDVAVDHNDHVWFSTNWLRTVYELDNFFGDVQRYNGSDIPNFRRIAFHQGHGYVLATGYAKKAELRVFDPSDFSVKKRYSLELESICSSADCLYFLDGEIIVGVHSTARSNALPPYVFTRLNPSTGRQQHQKIDGIVSSCVFEDTIYALSDRRDGVSRRKGTPKYYLAAFDPSLKLKKSFPLDLPEFTCYDERIHVDREGNLFRFGYVYNDSEGRFNPWLAVFDRQGKNIAQGRVPFGFQSICLDNQNNLVSIVSYRAPDGSGHILALKHELQYDKE